MPQGHTTQQARPAEVSIFMYSGLSAAKVKISFSSVISGFLNKFVRHLEWSAKNLSRKNLDLDDDRMFKNWLAIRDILRGAQQGSNARDNSTPGVDLLLSKPAYSGLRKAIDALEAAMEE